MISIENFKMENFYWK